MNKKIIYFSIILLSFIWCFSIILAPYLKATKSGYNIFIYFFFSRICHQLPERSFYIFGEKFAVCERCTSIYFSFFVGTVFFPLIRKIKTEYLKICLYISIFFIVIDFLFGYIYFQNIYSIIISGSALGLCSSYFVVYGIINSFNKSNQNLEAKKIGR